MFVHLHVHSPFSFLDGGSRLEELIRTAAGYDMPALAITDHHTVSAAVRFRRLAEAAGIKPIIGAEVEVEAAVPLAGGTPAPVTGGSPAPLAGGRGVGGAGDAYRGGHLVLLARDAVGYANLCRLLTAAHLGNQRGQPLVRWADLERYHEGLIALSGCRRGEIPRLILARRYREAEEVARRLQAIFSGRALAGLADGPAGATTGISGGTPGGNLGESDLAGSVRAARDAATGICSSVGAGEAGFYMELQGNLLPREMALNRALAELGKHLGIPLVASADVHYARREDFPVHDLLTCVRTLTRADDVHPERRLNAQNYLRSPAEMEALFAEWSEALSNTLEIAARCQPALEGVIPGRRAPADLEGVASGASAARRGGRAPAGEGWLYPAFPLPPEAPAGMTAAGFLRQQVYEGARQRYGTVADRIRERLEHELDIICRLGFEDYFLLVWDVARFARERGIRYAGRGSAADSAVAYCLFITEVDSIRRGLLFERFMSPERAEKPDIDIDFDARYRDEVTRYVYEKYGADHVAGVATYNTFGARAAVRDLGKALDLPPAEIDRFAKRVPYYLDADDLDRAFASVPELRDSGLDPRRFRLLIEIGRRVAGFPRHLGTHLGGVVISRRPLVEVSPLQMAAKGITIVQFDKDDVETLGLVKLDLLCLRTMGAIEEACRSIAGRDPGFRYGDIPLDDPATFEMINEGRTIGVFQLESPAQRALQARLGASCQEDLVASVALIRPGPVKGNMVEPFIARRQGKEPPRYLHPALCPILEKTYGVVLFQEQVIEIATAVAGFTPGEADRLRRVMTHARSQREMEEIGRHFVEKARARGVEEEVARAIFAQIAGYASYGFCEAHAAAFADIAYRTAYLVRHHPADFFAAILTLQPMGYYPPETVVVEARRRGIPVLGPDINRSEDHFTVEPPAASPPAAAPGAGREPGSGCEPGPECGAGPAGGRLVVRTSLRAVKGMPERGLEAVLEARRRDGPFTSLEDFCRRLVRPRDTAGVRDACGVSPGDGAGREVGPAGLDQDVIENLILCGAFDSLHPNRRSLMWALPALLQGCRGDLLPGLAPGLPSAVGMALAADFTPLEKLAWEHEILGFGVSGHLMGHLRPYLKRRGYMSSREVAGMPEGSRVKVAGAAIRPHRPPTKSGRIVVFLSLEDEFGLVDVTVFESVYRRYGAHIFGEAVPPLAAGGVLERRGRAVSVRARWIVPLPRLR
ncbi:MAG: DNA polymerase III subunit alpha [Bacillota bacterium]|nr:DNA polymerase III subunit alpha [Bacillota bacterium]